MNKIFSAIILLFLVSCSAKLAPVTQADADFGNTKFGEVTVASLQEGKALYKTNCRYCHGLKSPTSRTEEKWNKIVPIMVKKVNKKKGEGTLNATQEELIRRYVVTMATVPKK